MTTITPPHRQFVALCKLAYTVAMTDWAMHRAAQAAEIFTAQAWDCVDRPISQECYLALMELREALAALPPDPISEAITPNLD